jgi:hypothetical protein
LPNSREEDFIIIPSAENGTLEICDKEKNIWIRQNSLRSSFPRLSQEIPVRIISLGSLKTKICFEVQHLKTGAVFKSACKMYWNRSYFLGYIGAINDKISKWEKGNL